MSLSPSSRAFFSDGRFAAGNRQERLLPNAHPPDTPFFPDVVKTHAWKINLDRFRERQWANQINAREKIGRASLSREILSLSSRISFSLVNAIFFFLFFFLFFSFLFIIAYGRMLERWRRYFLLRNYFPRSTRSCIYHTRNVKSLYRFWISELCIWDGIKFNMCT